MSDKYAELRRLCEAATPGPWESDDGGVGPVGVRMTVADCTWPGSVEECPQVGVNADFIALCRTAAPDLLAERDALLAEVERLRAEANELRREVFAGLWAVSKDEAATLTDAQYRAMLGRLRQQWGMAPTGPDSDGGEAD